MAEKPTDATDQILAELEPGNPLADAVERHLNAEGGPVPVDEAALKRAVASASRRIASMDDAPTTRSPWVYVALAAMALIALASWWSQPVGEAIDFGPGIAVIDGSAEPRETTLVLTSGELRFERNETVQPRFDRVALPHLDIELVPVGTAFRVTTTDRDAILHVTQGAVLVEIGGVERDRVETDEVARLDASGVHPVSAAVAVAPTPRLAPIPSPPATPDTPAAAEPARHVRVTPDLELPAVLVLLGAPALDEPDTEQKRAIVAAADQIGSTRTVVPLASAIDPQQVAPEHAAVAWMAFGRDREAHGQLAEALAAYERVDANHWLHPWACLRKGAILFQLSEYDGAKKHLREAIAAGGRTEKAARLMLGEVHLAHGEPDSAMWAWRKSGVQSATNDLMRVKVQRLNGKKMRGIWTPELTEVERLLALEHPYATAVLDPVGSTPVVRARLQAEPALIELMAEHRALGELGATLNTTHDPELTDAHQRALAEHLEAGDLATKRALSDLATEIRRALLK